MSLKTLIVAHNNLLVSTLRTLYIRSINSKKEINESNYQHQH